MTDKQIIIDGVDVSGDKFVLNCRCEKLKRKEQEYEGLGQAYHKTNELLQEKTKECTNLKAENEILKEKLEIAIKNNMDKTLLRLKNGDVQEELQEIREQFGIETLYFHDDNTRVHRCLDVLRLKDTLTEIKEIAEKCRSSLYGYDQEKYPKQILQKISEVEVC